MNIIYQHAQKGITTIIILTCILVFMMVMITYVNPLSAEMGNVLYFIFGIFLLTGLFMYQLKVTLTDTEIRVQYGIAPVFPVFPLEDIAEVHAVRNPWWVGWGIRYAINYWVYNVSGYGAVELVKKDGSRVRIGTDEPEVLVEKIREVLK